MIINNEKDRLKAMRLLEDAKLPASFIVEPVDPKTIRDDGGYAILCDGLGDHPSGYTNDGGRDINDD